MGDDTGEGRVSAHSTVRMNAYTVLPSLFRDYPVPGIVMRFIELRDSIANGPLVSLTPSAVVRAVCRDDRTVCL